MRHEIGIEVLTRQRLGRAFFLCCCLWLILNYAPTSWARTLAEDPWTKVKLLIESGQWDRAETQVKSLLEQDPRLAQAHYLFGFISGYRKNYLQSIQSFQEALRLEPKNPVYRLALAAAFAETDNLKACETELLQVLEIQSTNAEAHYWLAHVSYLQKKDSAAIREAQEALRLNPGHLRSCLLLGELYYLANDLVASRQVYERALQIEPMPEAHYGLARIYSLNSEQNAQAIEHLKKALQRKPKDLPALSLLATVYSQIQQNEKAVQIYRQILRFNPKAVDAMVSLGRLLTITGHDQEGAQFLEKADRLRQQLSQEEERASSIKNALLRANDLAKENRLDDALGKTDEALRLNPRNSDALALRARILLQLKQLSQAGMLIEKAIEYNPFFAPHYYLLGLVRRGEGRNQEALTAFQQALVLDPQMQEAASRIKELQKSIEELQKK